MFDCVLLQSTIVFNYCMKPILSLTGTETIKKDYGKTHGVLTLSATKRHFRCLTLARHRSDVIKSGAVCDGYAYNV